MSFWSTLGAMGHEAAKYANPLVGTFDAAKVVAASQDPKDSEITHSEQAAQFASAFFKPQAAAISPILNSSPVQAVLKPLNWTADQASHGLATVAGLGGMLQDAGHTGIDTLWSSDLWSADNWSKAWDASEGVSGGEAIAYDLKNQYSGQSDTAAGHRWWDPQDRADFEKTRKETGFRLSAGAADIITTWYADPTIVLGKAAKAARAGSRIVDAAQADEVASVIGKVGTDASTVTNRNVAQRAAGAFATSPEETANRLWDNVSKTDNMDFDQTAAHFKQNLERTGDAGPIVGILGQAGKIKDLDLQRRVKADALLAAAGSQVARDRLITNAPDIARALQRASLPPESFAIVDDMVASGLTGQSLLDAAGRWASKENRKELEAYATELDKVHTRLAAIDAVGRRGGVEQVSGSVLGSVKSKYRAGMAREFFFQPGPHSRTVRVVHWATGQRAKGVVAVDDAVRGHDELMDTMMRSGLFSAEERKALSEKWWQAPTKTDRSNMVQALPEVMLNKLASKHGLTREQLDWATQAHRGWASAARTYTTKQMEAARAENLGRVVLEDPLTGTPTSIDRALFESHIENNVGIPDVATLDRLARHATQATTAGDKVKHAGWVALNSAETVNDLWRTYTLARPGFMARTQFDTQARAAIMVGATAVVRNAVKGLGHKMTDKLAGEQVVKVDALASDLLRQQNLRREAADLRRQAETQPGDAGRNMVQRATHLESEADKVVTYDATARRLVTQNRTLNVGGQKVTTRAAASQAEAEGIIPALHTGDAGIYDAILRTQGKLKANLAENSSSWVTTMPDDLTWGASWLRSKDAMMRSSAGKAILNALDEPSVDMVRHLKADEGVRSAWRAVRDQNPEFDSWLDRAIAQVEWTAPTKEVRDALRSGKVLNEEDVNRLFKPAEAVSQKQALAEADRYATQAEPLTAKVAERQARADAARAKADKARRDDTRQKHSDLADRHQARADKAQAKLDEISNPATVAPEHVDLADRMPVHAPAMDVLDPRDHGIQKATDMAKRFVRWMSDTPDTVLGRVPVYTERYFTHYRELAEREIARNGALGLEARARIEQVARHRSIQDVRQVMYDTARFTGAHDRVARIGLAFFGAWEDSMRAWGRMMYDDPARFGKLMKTWYAPDRGGLIVDENGDPAHAGEKTREKWVVLPVDWIPGVDFKEFKVRKDSFNSMFQGDVPWMPGFGPGVQVPVTQIAARTFPEVADPNFAIGGVNVGSNPVMRQLFGFGLPKTGVGLEAGAGSVASQLTPGWMRRLKSIAGGDDPQFTDAYSMALNTELMNAREAGKDPNSKAVLEAADKKAQSVARSMMFLEFTSNFGLGLSGEGSTKADFYRMRYREISKNAAELAARGTTPAEEMARQHPEVAGLKWSFSENATGINASLAVENRIRKYGKDIQKNPEYGWFYVGSDNVGGEFSAASYAAQFGREGVAGSGDAWRSKDDPAGIRTKTAASLGWDQYYSVKDSIDAELMKRGLHSLQQKGAEDLADVMKTFKSDLSSENPEWAKDYGSFDSSTMQTFLDQVAAPAMKDGRLKNRSDIKMMADYLALRQEAMAQANANGYSLGSRSAANLRAILVQAGQEMSQENIGFSQMWQRVLSREVDLATDDFPADTGATASSALKF